MYLYVFMRVRFLNFVLVVNDCFLARMVWQQQNHDLTDTVQRVYCFKVHQIGKQFKLLHRHKLVQRPQLASFPGHGKPAALRLCRWPMRSGHGRMRNVGKTERAAQRAMVVLHRAYGCGSAVWREVRGHPSAANRWECIELGFVRVWRRTVNEQGGRRKNHEIGVSEFSSGERPPGTVVCSKKGVDDTV